MTTAIRCGIQNNNYKHDHASGGKVSRTYKIWANMIRRCSQPKAISYKYYGGRGIVVCEHWKKFENFLTDMGVKPGPKHSLDRKNNNGNYEPSNCRWATLKEQSNNSRWNRIIEFNGHQKTLAQWAETTGINYKTIHTRLSNGWPIDKIFQEVKNDNRN